MSNATNQGRSHPRPRLRLFIWSVMTAAIFWTLIYQAGKKDGGVPDFVYVNF